MMFLPVEAKQIRRNIGTIMHDVVVVWADASVTCYIEQFDPLDQRINRKI